MLDVLINGVLTGAIAFVVFIGIFNFAAWRIRKQSERENR